MAINPLEVIKKTADLSKKIFDGEKFAIPTLEIRAKKAAANHPNDQTLRMMYNVLSKMSDNNKLFITRSELRNLYSKFASANNKAAGYFEEELAFEDINPVKRMKYSEDTRDLFKEAVDQSTDKTISNALSDIWDDKGRINKFAEDKSYNPEYANKASNLVNLTLVRFGLEPKKVNVFAGSDSCIVCDASYSTPKGETHILIPVELSKSGALLPTVFVTKYGFVDLTKEAVSNYINQYAGQSFIVNGNLLIDTLTSIKKLASLDEFELQVMMAKNSANSKKGIVKEACAGNEVLTGNPILIEKMPEVQEDIELPELKETASFAAMMETPKGQAEYTFGKRAVDHGRNIVYNRFRNYGINPQIAVAGCDDDSITYAVKIDTGNGPMGFQVLAEVVNDKLMLPNIIAAKDKVYEFSKEGIHQAISSNVSDQSMVAKVSAMYDLKPSEIMARLRKAADDKDYRAAEEALDVLAEKADAETYTMGLTEYMRSLSGMNKQASTKCGCKKIVKSSSHVGQVCGHLNLPIEKVYQDERGECRPLYRRNIEEFHEGIMFNANKIFF